MSKANKDTRTALGISSRRFFPSLRNLRDALGIRRNAKTSTRTIETGLPILAKVRCRSPTTTDDERAGDILGAPRNAKAKSKKQKTET